MTNLSRRSLMHSVAMTGAAMVVPALPAEAQGNGGQARLQGASVAERRRMAEPLVAYFRETAPKLLRAAQGSFRHPTIAPSLPGKQYSAELWDWDTLWTAQGLFRFARVVGDEGFRAQVAEHAKGSLLVFFDHQTPEGRMPIVLNATKPVLGEVVRTVPNHQNQAKPVFGQLALLIAEETGKVDWLAPVFDRLLRFYDSWLLGNETGTALLVWGDDVAIGNDNDPTTFGRPYFSSANLLLNCLFYEDLRAAQTLSARLGRPATEQTMLGARVERLGRAIEKECWDPRDAFYYTVDVQCVDRRAELIPTVARGMNMTWATVPLRLQVFTGFLPMWCGLATKAQAEELMARNYMADERFRARYGVRSLSKLETMYSMEFSSNPSNWLGPAWVIVNYFAWRGFLKYGFKEAADDLAGKTVELLVKCLAKDGALNEYYHPDTGVGLSHQGFMDWGLLVMEMI